MDARVLAVLRTHISSAELMKSSAAHIARPYCDESLPFLRRKVAVADFLQHMIAKASDSRFEVLALQKILKQTEGFEIRGENDASLSASITRLDLVNVSLQQQFESVAARGFCNAYFSMRDNKETMLYSTFAQRLFTAVQVRLLGVLDKRRQSWAAWRDEKGDGFLFLFSSAAHLEASIYNLSRQKPNARWRPISCDAFRFLEKPKRSLKANGFSLDVIAGDAEHNAFKDIMCVENTKTLKWDDEMFD